MKPLWQNILFPRLCVACKQNLLDDEQIFCRHCSAVLPRTNFHLDQSSAANQRFFGKTTIERCACYCYFELGSPIRQAIHQLKYHHRGDIAQSLAYHFAQELKQAHWPDDIDCIIPVPIHWAKQLQRGYNQSDLIARGIQKSWHLPIERHLIYRSRYTATQTHKSLYQRSSNITQAIRPKKHKQHPYHHILLVDDVLTSGATLVACCQALQAIKPVKISIFTLGFAE